MKALLLLLLLLLLLDNFQIAPFISPNDCSAFHPLTRQRLLGSFVPSIITIKITFTFQASQNVKLRGIFELMANIAINNVLAFPAHTHNEKYHIPCFVYNLLIYQSG
jgi:hypothetical protein